MSGFDNLPRTVLPPQTVSLDDFYHLLIDDELPTEYLKIILAIFDDIRPHNADFQTNTPSLVQLAALHSPTFNTIPAAQQEFLSSVMTMPIFFHS